MKIECSIGHRKQTSEEEPHTHQIHLSRLCRQLNNVHCRAEEKEKKKHEAKPTPKLFVHNNRHNFSSNAFVFCSFSEATIAVERETEKEISIMCS